MVKHCHRQREQNILGPVRRFVEQIGFGGLHDIHQLRPATQELGSEP